MATRESTTGVKPVGLGGMGVGRSRILLVDDDASVRFGVRDFLDVHGFDVVTAATCREAEEAFDRESPELVLLDFQLPDGDALDLLSRFVTRAGNVPVLILTAHGSIERAVEAIKSGAEQFLTKPVELEALLVILERCLENQRVRKLQIAEQNLRARAPLDPFAGSSRAIRELADGAKRTLDSTSAILILGETGTGKGVLATWMHGHGPRANQAFVDLNCAGLAGDLLESELFGHERGAFTGAVAAKAGLFEVAHRGAVFLDEIGDMDLGVQGKLLKVLEERRFRRIGETRDRLVDIQLLAATHQNLSQCVAEKRFREDLYYRVHVLPLRVPPLRERPEDIPAITRTLVKRLAGEMGRAEPDVTSEATEMLRGHSWPGNVRELRNTLERALLHCDGPEILRGDLRLDATSVSAAALEGSAVTPESSGWTLLEMERYHIARVLEQEDGHVERAARRLGVPRSSLYQKIKTFGLRSGPASRSARASQRPPAGEADPRRSMV